jgi:hypothetical protein
VRSSPHVDFEYLSTSVLDDVQKTHAANEALARDLQVQVRRAIADGLRVAVHEI